MKFTCEKNALSTAVNITQRAISNRSAHAILEGILIDAQQDGIILTGNDLEIGIESFANAKVITPGTTVVNAKLFGEIVRKISGDQITFELSAENNMATIKSGRSTFKVTCMDPQEYIKIPEAKTQNEISLTFKQLKDLVKHTIFAVGTNETKAILTGCLLEIEDGAATMVAVDGFRLALKKVAMDNAVKASFVIPAKTLKELIRILPDSDGSVSIDYSDKNAVFRFEGVKFTSRLLEGEFLDYRKIIPALYKTTMSIDVKDLIEAVERVSVMITGGEMSKSEIVIDMTDSGLNISCETPTGNAEESITLAITGNKFKIGFNSRYLLDALKNVPDQKVQINFVGHINPCLILPVQGDDYKYIVLPVRLRR